MMRSAAAMAEGQIIGPSDLVLTPPQLTAQARGGDRYLDLPLTEGRNQLVEDFELVMISRAVEREDGDVSSAARRPGIHCQSLQRKMKQPGLRQDQ